MKKRQILTLILALIGSVLLVACAGEPQIVEVEVTKEVEVIKEVEVPVEVEKIVEVEKEVEVIKEVEVEVPADDGVITIEYWQYFFDARVDAMNRLIQQFEAENPDIRVVHNSDIPYADFRDKIAASAPAGVGPDVATMFYGWIPTWVDAGYLIPLPEDEFPRELIESQFSPMVLQSEFDGEFWALPTAVRSLALFWNRDIFEAAGLDPDSPPTTLEELNEMAQALTVYDAAGNIEIEGFPVGMAGQAHHWFREVLLRQYGGVPYSDDGRTVMYNSPEGCEAFTALSRFEVEWNTGSNDLFEDATTAFLQGKSALHIDGSFRIGSIAKNAPDLNYGVTELPTHNDIQSTYGSYWTHGITRKASEDPARLEAATRFVKFITSPAAGALWVDKVGELPAQLESAADEELIADPILGAFSAGLAYSYSTFFVDESAQRQVLIDAYDSVRLADADPCEALAEAAEVEQGLLDDFWSGR